MSNIIEIIAIDGINSLTLNPIYMSIVASTEQTWQKSPKNKSHCVFITLE